LVLDAKEAVLAAIRHLTELFENTITDVLLEEIEEDGLAGVWRVTLSFTRPTLSSPVSSTGGLLGQALALKASRQYKVIEIDGTNGTLRSMKIRAM
jgi:hypothetical protein